MQENEQRHGHRKMRAVDNPLSQDGPTEQESKCQSVGDATMRTAGDHHMGLSPSARMGALHLRE